MAAEYTKLILRHTRSNSKILNEDYIVPSNSYSGLNTITAAEPWVQTDNKQLWVDGVCINPTIVTSTTSPNHNVSLLSTTYDWGHEDNQRYLQIGFDYSGLLSALSADSYSFLIQNNDDLTATTIYNPFNNSFYNKLWMHEHINIHALDANRGFGITSEYIDTVSLETGSNVITIIGGNAKDDNNASIVAANLYLVVKSNFDNYNVVDVTSLTGGSGSSTTPYLTPSTPNDNMYVTLSNGGGSFTLAGPKQDALNDRTGTDVRFDISSTTVAMHINVIDGGLIEDNSQSVNPNPAQ